ncbi:MAG TPA: T9SS type A sorting domain-containing protein, partial [Bacteroidales bacterium]|nr:T9SS type A sorting domain-containing protein [Bacteroidales bacterium]
SHVIRYRTNWSQPVTDPCNTYSYGNCCDFTVQIGGVPPQSWLTAEPMSGTLSPGQSGTVKVKFNSAGLDFGTYTGSVIFNNNSSTPVVTVPVTLIVEQGCPLPPPTDLTLQQTGYNPNVVQLSWVAPEEPGGVIRWDNGINNDGIGLVNGGTFAVAAKWNPDQLTQHVGLYLKQVDIFPRSATATYIIKVWTSATVSQPVVSQSATVVSEQWNTITLTNPVQIEAGKPLYIGYETTHGVSEYPAGCDSGPAIANFGDLISTGGGAWVSMSTQFGLDYNWNIAGIIGIGTDGAAPAVPIVITPNPDVSYGSPVAGNLGKPNNAKWVNTSRALVGYDIKRDGQVIGSVGPTVTTYTDSNVQGGTRIYNVGAHYTECTAWSDPATINVFVTELSPDATTLRIYPNPASETVNIESTTIKQIIIVNNLGQVVYDSLFNNDYVQINTSNLRKGMYVIFIRTAGTTFTEKLIIK